MAGRARHLPRHLHRRLLLAMAQQTSRFTVDELLASLGPTLQRFRRREVVRFLMDLVRMRMLLVEGQSVRRFQRSQDEDWLHTCRAILDGVAERQSGVPS